MIIEHGSMEVVKEIESFYEELGRRIEEDDDQYNEEKLPKLLSLLKNYEVGTSEHTLYEKRIQMDMELQAKHYMMQVESLAKRQSQVIESFQQAKNRIIEQTDRMTAGLLETIQHQQLSLNGNIPGGQPLFTPAPERQAITDGSK